MYLAYIDESGRPFRADPENYVLSTLIVGENYWQEIDNLVTQIKIKYFPALPVDTVEFHAKEMMNREGIFKGYKLDEIFDMFEDIFQLIKDKSDNLCTISVIIDKAKLYPDKDAELWAYRLLIERINNHLTKVNTQLQAAGSPPQYGIMIIDSVNRRVDQRVRNKISYMMRRGTYYSKLEYLIEDPLFTDSKWRNLSQLVDCIAYCVRRYHKNGVSASYVQTKWHELYRLIIPAIDCSETGTIQGYGIKIFP